MGSEVMHSLFLLSLKIFLFFNLPPSAFSSMLPSNETDRLALLSFKAELNSNDPLRTIASWNSFLYVRRCNLWLKAPVRYSNCIAINGIDGYIVACHRYLDFGGNRLMGNIPSEFQSLSKTEILIMDYKNLTGGIPASLGNIWSLQHISGAGNNFQGSVPDTLGLLRYLRYLRFYMNKLSANEARIKCKRIYWKSAYFHRNLEWLALDFNNLGDGEADDLNFLPSSLTGFFIAGNSFRGGIPPSLSSLRGLEFLDLSSNNLTGKTPSYLGSFPFLQGDIPIRFSPSRFPKKDMFPKVSYGSLHKATDGFSQTNLIGSGKFSSVYKGTLEKYEKVVAVKVLNLDVGGATKSFIHECEALRSIRHRNLVKIFTICSSIAFQGNDFKALVYAYMENGSLDKYGMGCEVSTYGNLYSYEILVLEIFKGKRPTDDMFRDDLSLQTFVKMAMPDRVMEILDSILLKNEGEEEETASGTFQGRKPPTFDNFEKCLSSVFRVGIACSVEFPRERMDISDVITELQLTRDRIKI
ncbi:hypothetical protein RJ639_001959 [Escallonia herrerae]|uniref:Protein kinase domain-containing protein n=1 Tax=Escallonia herrerae TaxID=1293975 RepID=A0AA88XJK5_9ASTE|nr:hypothetical protein RJ639_001959 [Escallonia herrerae]